eukprot:m.47809 g.47809  ORF g.47809 m.47809 type:complete len:97 (+) comp13245_c0_seq1:154-444(+)
MASTPNKGLIAEANKQLAAMHQQMQDQEESFSVTIQEKDRTIKELRETIAVLQDNVRSQQQAERLLRAQLEEANQDASSVRAILERVASLATSGSK